MFEWVKTVHALDRAATAISSPLQLHGIDAELQLT
jgi:hypothetical protein